MSSSVETGPPPRNLQGAGLMVLSGAGFTVHTYLAQALSADLHPVAIAFWRSAAALFITLPFLLSGRARLRPVRMPALLARSLFGTLGFVFSMLALWEIYALSLAEFSALSFTRPLFVTILAVLLLRELVGVHRWGAVVVGFAGVMVMVAPSLAAGTGGAALAKGFALLSSFCFAGAIILVKTLTDDHSPMELLIWANLLSTVLLGAGIAAAAATWPAAGLWAVPGPDLLWLVAGMAVSGVGAQFCYIWSMSIADASFVSPMDYLRLPMTSFADWLIGRGLPGPSVWLGAAVIVASTLYITAREARKRALARKLQAP